MKTIHFAAITPSGDTDRSFQRHAFYCMEGQTPQLFPVLVHYVGDHSNSTDFPHGNSKPGSISSFTRTCPSVLAEPSASNDLPSNVYKKTVWNTRCESPELQASCMPHNKRQITNIQYRQRRKFRLTHDVLYNLHELAFDTDGFVKAITTFLSLIVICGLQGIIYQGSHRSLRNHCYSILTDKSKKMRLN